MSDTPTYNFDILGAKNELGAKETLNYMRNNLDSNINWDAIDESFGQDYESALNALQGQNITITGKKALNYDAKNTQQKIKDEIISKQTAREVDGFDIAGDLGSSVLDNLTFGLFDTAQGWFGETSEEKRNELINNIEAKLLQGQTLSDTEQHYLQNNADKLKLFDERAVYSAQAKDQSGQEFLKTLQDNLKDKDTIFDAQSYSDLSDSQKKQVDSSFNIFDDVFDYFTNKSNDERLKEYKEAQNAKILSEDLTKTLIWYENTEEAKDIFSLFGASKENKEKYLSHANTIALSAGFDGVAVNAKDEIYFYKTDENGNTQAYKPNTGFIDNFFTYLKSNAGSIGGGVAGGIAGFKKAPNNPASKAVGLIGGSAVGAFTGGGIDYLIADYVTKRDFNFDSMLRHMSQEGALSLGVDVAGLSIKAVGKLGGKAIKNTPEIIGKVTDYIPVVGTLKRFKSGNSKAAYEPIRQIYTKEQLKDLSDFAKEFGGDISLGTPSKVDTSLEKLGAKLGEDSKLYKSAQWLKDIFSLSDQRQTQREFLTAIRADESGHLNGFITQVAKESPTITKNLKNILNTTTQNLERKLEQLKIDSVSVKDIFNTFEKDTKDDYTTAMEKILSNVYDSNYKTTLPRTNYENFRLALDERGILPEDSLRFLNFVEKNIYNKNGVDFSQLNNALKTINSYYKQSLDPNFKDFIKQSVENFLKDDIKKGIDSILAQNPILYKDASTLFESALKDYATMKSTLKRVDRLKLRDEAMAKSKALQNVYKYLQGQGGEEANIALLTKGLSPDLKARLELNILQGLFQKNLIEFSKSAKVFDSSEFFKNLESLKLQFESKEAKDYIDIAKGFDKLFKNDALIAQSISEPISKEVGSSIATTISGAVKFQAVKIMFEALMRLMPKIPFAKGFNEKIQGMALRFHLRKALSVSNDISDFRHTLQAVSENPSLNSQTRQIINKILGQVDEAQENIIKQIDEVSTPKETPAPKEAPNVEPAPKGEAPNENDIIAEFGTNYAEFYHDGKGAIKKLLSEKQGQVAGAFYKENLGDIDLVWGNEKFGLQHILEQRTKQWGEQKALNFIDELPSIINQAKFFREYESKVEFITDKETLVFAKRNDRHFVLTALIDKRNKKRMGTTQTGVAGSFTDETLALKPLSSNIPNNSTTPAKINQPSPLELALKHKEQALKEAQDKIQAEQLAMQARLEELKAKQASMQAQKEALNGLSANERILEVGEPIKAKATPLADSSISLQDNEIIPLEFKIIKSKDAKPNFENTNLQGRLETKQKTIQAIANDFKPNLILGRGGFKDLPILNIDGAVISGNHRIKGMQDFSETSRKAYEEAIQKQYNIHLEPDELLVRMPKEALSDEKLINLSLASNVDNVDSLGDKAVIALGKYANNLKELPNHLEGESVDELAYLVARKLEKDNAYPDILDCNLALLANLAKNSNNKSLGNVLNNLKLPLDEKNKLVEMYAKNAGAFHNLVNDFGEYGAHKLEIRPYLLDSIEASANGLSKTRAENFKVVGKDIANLIATTDSKGLNPLISQNPKIYDNLLSQSLGYALSRFVRLENPASSLYEVLKNAKDEIEAIIQPTFFREGKALKDADIYDFIEMLITKGEASNESSELIELLPKLREKHEAYKANMPKDTPPTTPTNTPKGDNPSVIARSASDEAIHNAESAKNGLPRGINPARNDESPTPKGEAPAPRNDEVTPNPQSSLRGEAQAIHKNAESTLNENDIIAEFGTNYAEFYHDGKGAIKKLLQEKQGQVAGAFYKENLGDIDLVWGNESIGLQKIVEKHLDDFKIWGEGQEGLIKGLNEIVESGKIETNAGVHTIILNKDGAEYRVGLSKGWLGKGENLWVITAYERKPHAQNFDQVASKVESGYNLPQEAKSNSTTKRTESEVSLDNTPKNTNPSNENNFNPLISQINAHLGSGLFGGSIAGLEQDDFGNYTFNPTKFAIGFVAGLAGYDIARRTKAFQNIERISANAKQYYPNLSQKAPDKLMDILRQGIVKKMSGNPSNYITKEKDLLAYAKELDSLFGKQEIENLTSKPKKQRPKPIPKKAQIQQATLFDLSDETLFKEIAQEVKPLLDEAEAKAQAGLFDNHILEGIDTSAPRIQDTPEVSLDSLNLKSENKPTSTTKEPNLFDFESYEPQSANAQLFNPQPKISEDSSTITTQTLKKDREIISKLDKATGEITQEVKFLPAPPTPAQSAEQIKLKITPQNVESEEVTRQSALKNILKSAKNYYFSPREEVKSPKLRLENNLNALKLLKEIHENPRALSEQDKEILNSYSGFGGLTNAFKEGSKELERLQALLNADEIKELKKTILDAYYTPTEIIDTIYKGLKDFLPQDAKVLEPSMGSGRFLGLGNKNYEYAGIEIDPLTFKIAQLLYPQSNIANANYLKMNLINDQFDLVIGNPPYGSLKVDYNQNYGLNIHNAFMLKNIDLAKENGIIAQVITTSFLDSFDSRTRRKVLEKARIIGTMRLSSDTFSGTNIATDIVILQKRPRSEWLDMTNPKQELSEIEARFLGVNQPIGDGFYENNLIKDAPRLSFSLPFMKATGEYTITRGEGGRERLGYEAISKESVNELLSEFSTRLKKYLKDFKTPKQSNDIQNLEELAQRQYTFGAYKVGEISFENGEVKKSFIADDGALETKSISLDELVFKDKVDEYKALASSSNLKPSDKAKLTKFNTQLKIAQTALPKITELKEVATKLNIMELEPNANQQELGILRAKLNNVYDSLMRELKPMMKTPSLNDKRLLNIFEGDVSYSSLSGLEKGVFDEEGELIGITKSDIFSKRVNNPTFTPLHADSPAQALEYSINYKGGVDYGYMAKLLNRDSHEVRQELLRENKVFLFDGQDVLEDTLLSGNIREKKAILEKALEYQYKGGTQEALYQKSLDKILENMPKDLEYSEIKYSIGSSFLPDEVFEGFFQRVYRDENGRFFSTAYTNNYAPHSSEYKVSDADVFNQATGYATRRFKDKHYSVSFDLAVKQLQKDFSEHIAQNPHLQDLITKAFNEKRNIYANPKEVTYSATKTYEGANPAIKLRPTQNRAVQKAVFGDKNILLNHEVGAGKTYTLITTAMELRRTNKSKKPLIAVPNHLVTQFQNDFLNLYPNAKIMSIQSVSDKNFSNLLNQIAYNDFDSVIVGHSVFDSINMPYAYQRDFYEDLIEEKKRLAGEASGSVERRIQRELKSLEDKLAGVQGNKKTNKDFTELGFDSLLLDEAHEYKNLPFASAYESKQMGSKLGSAKAMNLLLKTSFLNKNGKKIVFATGTPMSNSLLEVHHMLRHLDPQGLKMFGIEHIDNFINDFVRIEKVLETKPTGERVFEDYIVGTRNNKTLMNFVNRVFDTIDMKEVIDQANLSGVKVILPNVLAQSAMIKKSKLVAELFDDIVLADAKYLKENPQGAMENGINHLTIFNNARKLSLDPRLLAPKRANEAIAKNPELLKDTKIHQSAQNIATIAKEWEKDKGTQVVFCDLGVNDILGFNAHKELKNQLLAQKDSSGKAIFEPQEVQIIGDWKKEKYKDLYKDINSGKVRVLITTTAKTGTGANIQKRMVAMHHLDSPYRPSDYTQRIGRLVRQGNELAIRASNEKSEFFAKNIVYATEETLDSRMFGMLEAKSRAFRNFYKGSDVETELNVKEMIDYDLMAAESSGNKNGIELVKVNKDIDELESLKQSQLREFSNKEKDIRKFSEKLAKLESELKTIDTFKPSFEGAKLEFNHQAFELDLKESLNKPASIVFDDEAQKANLQALREAMNKQKETILQKLESGIPYNLYSYNGADLYAVKDNLAELTFFFEKESKRYFLEGTRRMLSNFSPSDSLNFLKILQNHTRKEGEKLREIAREKTNLAKAKACKEAFDEQERLDALLEYAQSLQEAVDKKIKELIPKPASLAKYAIVSGAGGLGAYAQAYERDNNQYKAL